MNQIVLDCGFVWIANLPVTQYGIGVFSASNGRQEKISMWLNYGWSRLLS